MTVTPTTTHPGIDRIRRVDQAAFARDLAELKAEIDATSGEADVAHLRKMMRWSRAASLAGFATAWIAPNPISAIALGLASFTRWTIVGHHVCHGAYDRIDGAPSHFDSRRFGRGWRRFIDWFDWFLPEAWHQEHDLDHHYNLGEAADPDSVELNTKWLHDERIPLVLRYLLVVPLALTWRFTYYAATTIDALHTARERRARPGDAAPATLLRREVWLPWYPRGRDLILKSWLLYGVGRFLLLPALVYGVSPWAALSLAINLILGELYANLHSFVVIVSNHAGGDLYSFGKPATTKAEFQLRQAVASVNFRTGGDLNDFLHGFLNYQIEHHLWPSWTPRRYQRAQPHVKEICARHGVPYVQQPVWSRFQRLIAVIVGVETATPVDTRASEPSPARAPRGFAQVPIRVGLRGAMHGL